MPENDRPESSSVSFASVRVSAHPRYLSVAVFPFIDPFTGGICGFANVATSASPSDLNVTMPRLVRHSPCNVGSPARAETQARTSSPEVRMTLRMVILLEG